MLYTKKLLRGFSITLAFSLLNQAIAWAGYKPPQPPIPTKVTGTTTGVRGGCYGDSETDLTAIAPISHVGQSGRQSPSFVWFVPEEDPLPMEFRLYELETDTVSNATKTTVRKKRIFAQTFESQKGWMTFDLPTTAEPLSTSKDYLWSVILHCNPNRPSRSQRIDAELKIHPLDDALNIQLEAISEPNRRAQFLAKQGYWYDAIRLLTPSTDADAIEAATIEARADLVAALAQLEPELQQKQLMEILKTQP